MTNNKTSNKPIWEDAPTEMVKIPKAMYERFAYLGLIDPTGVRKENVGDSNYAEKTIQPHSIWLDYPELTSFDHDIVKRILRTKKGQSRLIEYEKIIDVCNERIRQLHITGEQWPALTGGEWAKHLEEERRQRPRLAFRI